MAHTSLDSGRKKASRSFRFPRTHRLKRKRLIEPLFDRDEPNTNTVSVGCIRVLYRFADPASVEVPTPLQVGFAVRRTVGGAVVRNRTKRILREVFRTNNERLLDQLSGREDVLTIMVVVRHLPDDEDVLRHDLIASLRSLEEELGTNNTTSVDSDTPASNDH